MIARNFVRAGEKETKELFQGKTYEELTGWHDFHARQYDAAVGRWFGVDAYTHSMPDVSPFNAMANNPVMFVDPDGNEPITLLVLGTAAVIGGGLNLWSNADKVKDFKSGLAYFASGAGGGMLSLVNPWAGGAFTSSANIGIDIATGNLPDFNNPWEVGKYAGYKILDGISAGQAGNMSRGLISFAESGRFAWNTTFFGNSAKFTPTSKELHWAVGGLDIGEVAIVSNRVRLSNLAAPALKQAANFVDDAAKTGYRSFNAFKNAYGSAGKGNAWHHIVEQHSDNVLKFGAESIHNANNLIKLPHGAGSIHMKITGHYNSLMPGTSMRVRDYIKTLSYDKQYQYGIDVLKRFGWTP